MHAFTFRDENVFLPADLRRGWGDAERGDGVAECVAFLEAGVDGLFTDHPDTAVAARDLTDPVQRDETGRLGCRRAAQASGPGLIPLAQTMRWSS